MKSQNCKRKSKQKEPNVKSLIFSLLSVVSKKDQLAKLSTKVED